MFTLAVFRPSRVSHAQGRFVGGHAWPVEGLHGSRHPSIFVLGATEAEIRRNDVVEGTFFLLLTCTCSTKATY